jgi:hypothetical protein
MSVLDRRAFFLGSLSVSSAVLLTPAARALAGAVDSATVIPLGTGHVDDMWGHFPPYAHPIPHGGAQPAPHPWEQLDPVDRMWGV